jgi:hypothetical protein
MYEFRNDVGKLSFQSFETITSFDGKVCRQCLRQLSRTTSFEIKGM